MTSTGKKNFCVYYGPTYVMFQADDVGDLKRMFRTGDAKSVVWKYELEGHEVEIVDKYIGNGEGSGHDLAAIKEKSPESILPDNWQPKGNGETVYLATTPLYDFEAYRQARYAEVRAENARLAKEKEEKEAKEAAEKAAKEAARAEREKNAAAA